MKKLLFIFVLISITLYACAQPDTDYEDLPEITTPSGTDGFVIYKGGSGYKMTYSTAFAAIIDSLQIHNDSLLSYDIRILFNLAAINWLSDTVFQHNLRLLTLEAGGGGGDSDSTWTSIEADTVFFSKIYGPNPMIWQNGGHLYFSDDVQSAMSLITMKRLVAGRASSSTAYSASASQDGYSVTWDNSNTEYTLTDINVSDTITMYAASIGRGLTGDSALFQTGATYQRIWYAGPDSIQIDTCRVVADDNDSSVDMDYNIIFQEQRISGSWTNVWSTPITISGADAITTGEITTTFTVDKIPPYSWIEIIFEETTVKATSLSVNLIGHYIQ